MTFWDFLVNYPFGALFAGWLLLMGIIRIIEAFRE